MMIIQVAKFSVTYNLKLKLEVVGIPAEKEWGTAETLRCVLLSLSVN
jgi:hypothetical protein